MSQPCDGPLEQIEPLKLAAELLRLKPKEPDSPYWEQDDITERVMRLSAVCIRQQFNEIADLRKLVDAQSRLLVYRNIDSPTVRELKAKLNIQ